MINLLLVVFLIEWTQIASTLGIPAFLLSIVVFVLKWIRFRSNDSAVVNMKNAETEKVKAEAAEIKAKADVTIVDSAFKLIQRLSDECDMTKKQLEKTQTDLDSAQDSLRNAIQKIEEVQSELNKEREKNKAMAERINTLTEEINKLKSLKDGA